MLDITSRNLIKRGQYQSEKGSHKVESECIADNSNLKVPIVSNTTALIAQPGSFISVEISTKE